MHWGAYSAPPDSLDVFRGPTSKRKRGGGREVKVGQGRESGSSSFAVGRKKAKSVPVTVHGVVDN